MANDQNLEPEAEQLLRAGRKNTEHMGTTPALYSIAISLKRIADAMTAPPVHWSQQPGLRDSRRPSDGSWMK